MSLALPLLIAAVVLVFAWWLMRRLFTGRSRAASSPPSASAPAPRQESKEVIKLRSRLAGLSAQEKQVIDRLRTEYASQLSPEVFAGIALIAADYAGFPLADLRKLTLRDQMSSVDTVNFVLLTEEFLDIDINDEQADRILTFGDLVRFVESATPNSRVNTDA
jgi:hypothetical protein